MKTYCPVRPSNRLRSLSSCSGVKTIQFDHRVEVQIAQGLAGGLQVRGCRRGSDVHPAGAGLKLWPRLSR